jgi:phenylacetate-CoA ligase
LYAIAQRAKRLGWNAPLRSIVTWGDNLYGHYRRTIEDAFKTRVFDTYGCGEGFQIAAQCGSNGAYHIHSPDVIVECVDDAGAPVNPGHVGNLILTRLHAGPMPFIRYHVGDVGVLGDSERCGCGRGYDLMRCVLGRDTDVVLTPSGNRLIVHFFTGILEHFPEISSFQVVQEQLKAITLRIVPAPTFSRETQSRIISKLQEMGGADLHIDVEVVHEIPVAPSGKRRFVIAKPSMSTGSAPN